RPDLSRRLVLARYPRKLPAVLSVEEVGRLLEAAPGSNTKPSSAPPTARACACPKWPASRKGVHTGNPLRPVPDFGDFPLYPPVAVMTPSPSDRVAESSFIIISRITNFWTLPVTVMGNSLTNRI